jgi:hypothetical protein
MALSLEALPVVFRMGSNPFHNDNAISISHLNYQAEMISLDVKDHAI